MATLRAPSDSDHFDGSQPGWPKTPPSDMATLRAPSDSDHFEVPLLGSA
jgi:hypothetical protein